MAINRCEWAAGDPLMERYHDKEWGISFHDDRRWFEFLILEGAQAGLSWRTILYRREGYRKAFQQFDVLKVSRMTSRDASRLLKDPGIIRNRLKVASTISNAKAFLKIQVEFNSFDRYIRQFAKRPRTIHRVQSLNDLPASTEEAEAISKDLRLRGFNFVGPTICYALMQATGLVDDHQKGCFRVRRGANATKVL